MNRPGQFDRADCWYVFSCVGLLEASYVSVLSDGENAHGPPALAGPLRDGATNASRVAAAARQLEGLTLAERLDFLPNRDAQRVAPERGWEIRSQGFESNLPGCCCCGGGGGGFGWFRHD
jgi:hypothetical protein